jgi:hypothetical protein
MELSNGGFLFLEDIVTTIQTLFVDPCYHEHYVYTYTPGDFLEDFWTAEMWRKVEMSAKKLCPG